MSDYEYFRAPGVAAVRAGMADDDFDGVFVKHIDPSVALGKLVAFALDHEYTVDLVDDKLIWPETGANDADYEGPWVTVLNDEVRDALAAVPAERLPGLSERWAAIEEFGGLFAAEELRGIAAELVELAAEARAAGDSIFCRMSL